MFTLKKSPSTKPIRLQEESACNEGVANVDKRKHCAYQGHLDISIEDP